MNPNNINKPYTFAWSRSGSRWKAARWIIIGSTAVFMVGVAALWRVPLGGGVWRILTPVAFARDGITHLFVSVTSGFRSTQTLAAENDSLRTQLLDAQQHSLDRDALYQENLTLKMQYDRGSEDDSHPVLAGIIARPPQLPYDTLIIDAGEDHHIAVGNKVSVGSAVIGTVTEVFPSDARVELFSSAGKDTDGELGGASVSTQGQGSGAMIIRLPTGVSAAVGDPITLPGINGGVFGIVTNIETSASSALKNVYLRSPINLNMIKFVMVDTNSKHVFNIETFLRGAAGAASSTAAGVGESGTGNTGNEGSIEAGNMGASTTPATTTVKISPQKADRKHR